MAGNNPYRTCALQPDGFIYEIAISDGDGLCPGNSGVGRPGGNGDGNDGVFNARAQGGNKGQGQN